MCTVTFIPAKQGCYITSSRDESVMRQKALSPDVHDYNRTKLVYPKDTKANGTWIAFTQTGHAAVLLNGAFVKHVSKPPYRKSRGLIFLDIIAHTQPDYYFLEINLEKIEPFTLILLISGNLFECRWDGDNKHFTQLDETKVHIWSSTTLYSHEIADKRKQWLEEWLMKSPEPTTPDMLNFHQSAGDGDTSNSVWMNRDNKMLTVSIASIYINREQASMQYLNLADKSISLKSLQLEPVSVYS